jgi:hypothetical protein
MKGAKGSGFRARARNATSWAGKTRALKCHGTSWRTSPLERDLDLARRLQSNDPSQLKLGSFNPCALAQAIASS